MKLVNVYKIKDGAAVLYELMRERSTEHDRFVNISHRKMPTWRSHLAYMRRKTNRVWYVIKIGNEYAGSLRIGKDDEIGIVLFRKFRGQGIGPKAIRMLMKRHKRARFIANINPKNGRSIAVFQKLGFKLLQQTYELRNA
jgi:RimJ/RimL family protein N-acetyltransferase